MFKKLTSKQPTSQKLTSQKSIRAVSTLAVPLLGLMVSLLTASCERVAATSPMSTSSSAQASKQVEQPVTLNSQNYRKSANATSKIEATPTKATLYFDSKKWKQDGLAEAGRVQFAHSTGEGFGLIIAERIQLSLPALRDAALENAKEVAPDARITDEEKRVVNGREVLQVRMKATVDGIPVEYIGYYFTGKEGSVQVLTYTSENLIEEYQKDFEEFLNGFTVGS